MIIIPAIDLKGGKCVRLRQGKADDSKVYSEDPVAMATHWSDQGADYLHVVDLDGAFQGKPAHADVVAKIVSASTMPVEIGGGLRTNDDIRTMLDCGIDRVIIGTRALTGLSGLKDLVAEFGDHLAVGIDARDGFVQVEGWVKGSEVKGIDLAKDVDSAGVKTLIYTDISRDGMMVGINAEAMESVCDAVSCNVIASGGVTEVNDVKTLKALARDNLSGVIVGKALYEESVTLKDLKEGLCC